MKVGTIIGARPQFIKASALSRAVADVPRIKEVIIHTGQHYDLNMSDIFFSELEIPRPDYYLGIGSSSHGAQTGRMLEAVEALLLKERPDCVLVYGDTNSTLAGALAAVKLHIPVAHVEAGLRSFNRKMPEEINRILTDHASDLLFAPTGVAVQNLLNEGIPAARIFQVGDIMYDASLYFGARAERHSNIIESLELESGAYILATIHRAENTDSVETLKLIFDGLRMTGREMPVVMPLHPRTRAVLENAGLLSCIAETIRFVEPVGFLDMVMLEKNAAVIVTDSGGVQKEAYFHRKPCVTLREETEWTELVDAGWNTIALPASGPKTVMTIILSAIGKRGKEMELYGDGRTAQRIMSILESAFLNK